MPPTKIAPELDLPIALDRGMHASLQQQLHGQLRQAMLDGRLAAKTRLPSTRALAQALGVSRTVTSAAYDELFAEGYIEGRRGSGTYVSSNLPVLPQARHPAPNVPPRWLGKAPIVLPDESNMPSVIAFRLGTPSLAALPPRIWRAVWRTVSSDLPPPTFGSHPALQAAIATYLGRSRGLACAAEDVLITAGATHALDLIARATLAAGDAVGCEEPGYPSAQHSLLARGAHIIPIPIDEDGMCVEALPTGSAAPLLVYCTPSHQFPLATRLSVARRLALLAWAKTNDSLIVEDDYDSEFRFDAAPLPALASLDNLERVAYIGTFSKVLTPALRVGYLVAPHVLRQRIKQIQYLTDEYVAWPLQQMLTAFITSGHLDRHIRRMRQHYAQKRHALADTVAKTVRISALVAL